MPRIERDIVEAVRDRTDIVEVVSRHVKLQRKGSSWVGLCPFHQEKTPSFNVIPSKGMYYCFGCQAAGDVYRFLMEIEGLSFVEAVKELAGTAGVTIEERKLTPRERRAIKERATLREVLDEAQSYFQSRLWTTSEGEVARKYLETRALSVEFSQEIGIGWAPSGWSSLCDHLQNKGYPPRLILEAGLAKRRERGDGIYDAFRARLMIPIRDERSRVIAFGGRILEGDGPKYINSPETALYHKSSVLYGLDMARKAIGKKDRVLLVEGYFDVLSLRQAGFEEAVATCGTSLTQAHIQKIRRLARTVIVLLDADEAGARAAERTLPMFIEAGIEAWRLQLPDAKDPDELVREGGPEALESALTHRESLFTWVTLRKLKQHGYSDGGKMRTLDEMLHLVGHLSPAQVSSFASLLRINESLLLERLKQHVQQQAQDPETEPYVQPSGWKPHRDVVHLLWLVVHRREQISDLIARLDPDVLAQHGPVKAPIARLIAGETLPAVLEDVEDSGLLRTLRAVAARSKLYTPEEATAALMDVLARLAKPLFEAHSDRLQHDLRSAQAEGSSENVRHVLRKIAEHQERKRLLGNALKSKDIESFMSLITPST